MVRRAGGAVLGSTAGPGGQRGINLQRNAACPDRAGRIYEEGNMIRRKMIFTFLALILALVFCGTDAFAEEAPVNALEMTRRMGNGINLGNTMEACNNGKSGGMTTGSPKYYETYWGQPVTTPEMLKAMKEAGFDTIRIPVAWMTNATHLSE